MSPHKPVLLNETIEYLVTKENGNYFDGTIGFGGHSSKILEKSQDESLLVGTDKDKAAFDYCKKLFEDEPRVRLYNTSFTNIDSISKIEFIEKYDGIFADLGVSSFQLDSKDAGFTFREDVPLDLRMNREEGLSAADLLNEFDEKEIARIIFEYGEEKKSRRIASKIIERRKKKRIETTFELREIISGIVPEFYLNKSLSRVFQALRIYVNNELEDLKVFLEKSVGLLEKGGRIAIISFHSLEDRIVKEAFKYETLDCICPPESPVCVCDKERRLKILTRKPVVASEEELKTNRRSRSAKLRVAERV
jgi:16S rRNA (cytosine1402-N4)-methyltransferase